MTAIAFLAISFAWSEARERVFLERHIRAQEEAVHGFLERTSILSDEARCRRAPLSSLISGLLGSDYCRL